MARHRKIEIGEVYHNLKVIGKVGIKPLSTYTVMYYSCECLLCGNVVEVPSITLGRQKKDCGCGKHRPHKPVEVGTKFGHLEVIEQGYQVNSKGTYHYKCKCDCPKHTILDIKGDLLLRGVITSCGCVRNKTIKSGHKNVYWIYNCFKWRVNVTHKGTVYYCGLYDDYEEACKVADQVEEELYKDFIKWYSEKFPK